MSFHIGYPALIGLCNLQQRSPAPSRRGILCPPPGRNDVDAAAQAERDQRLQERVLGKAKTFPYCLAACGELASSSCVTFILTNRRCCTAAASLLKSLSYSLKGGGCPLPFSIGAEEEQGAWPADVFPVGKGPIQAQRGGIP